MSIMRDYPHYKTVEKHKIMDLTFNYFIKCNGPYLNCPTKCNRSIYNISPYNGNLIYPEYYSVKGSRQGPHLGFSNKAEYERYFIRRGYAIVYANSLGTIGSDGCPTIGDEQEILAAKAVIDWLNDRAMAYDAKNKLINAEWASGKVGMIGLSYEGTIPNGVATTGVEGLETIVPIGAISNWYDYYRANGAVVAPGGYQGDDADRLARGILTRNNSEICQECITQLTFDQDRKTGNYNDFWEARNYLNHVENIKASVFVVHGLNDMNVKRKQFAKWWEQLTYYDIPRKLWLHQGGHIDPKITGGYKWLKTLHRWFDYWLYSIDNGIMNESRVTIQRETMNWHHENDWPAENVVDQTLFLCVDEHGKGALRTENVVSKKTASTFSDHPRKNATMLIQDPEMTSPNRLSFLTTPLAQSVRLSGFPRISIEASVNKTSGTLTALLVDYGPSDATIVTRGWMNIENIHSIRESEKLKTNTKYTFTWDLEPHDYIFSPSHQIGLVLMSSDFEYTLRPDTSIDITVFYSHSCIQLPLVTHKNILHK